MAAITYGLKKGEQRFREDKRLEGVITALENNLSKNRRRKKLSYLCLTPLLIRAVKRNLPRFPDDFMFQLNEEESENLRFHFGTSSQWGGRRYPPYAFTEQGVAMLSSVLRSKRAIQVNIEIMRAFVRLRRLLASHADLARKLDALERKYDAQFKVVFDTIRELMKPPESKKRPIGFLVEEAKVRYITKMKRKS
jgi:hypothetical protein